MFELKLHNFRSFRNQKFNFKRINILIGENSGGKSSLLKFLLALNQTLDSERESNLKLRGDFTDLGNYEEVVFDKKINLNIEFGFKTSKPELINFYQTVIKNSNRVRPNQILLEEILKKLEGSWTSIDFVIGPNLSEHNTILTTISNSALGKVSFQTHGSERDYSDSLKADLKFEFSEIGSSTIFDCGCHKEGFFTIFDWDLVNLISEDDSDYKDRLVHYIVFFLLYQNFVGDYIREINFVNPISSTPKRFYFQEDRKASYRHIDLERMINFLGDPMLSDASKATILESLNSIISTSGIAEEIKIVREKNIPVLALNIRNKNFWANVTDVGYGVSLHLPILFQAWLSESSPKGEVLLIEQPEVHLHPSLQAKFIETILSIGEKNQYYIETHSEHIIRKLQVLVKNKEYGLTADDISIHYFKRESKKFEITEHKIGEDGRLSPKFPTGFFDTSYNLAKELL